MYFVDLALICVSRLGNASAPIVANHLGKATLEIYFCNKYSILELIVQKVFRRICPKKGLFFGDSKLVRTFVSRLNLSKPVEDNRTMRLALAQQVPPDQKPFTMKKSALLEGEIEMIDTKITKRPKFKRRQKGQVPNLYGLSRKELKI